MQVSEIIYLFYVNSTLFYYDVIRNFKNNNKLIFESMIYALCILLNCKKNMDFDINYDFSYIHVKYLIYYIIAIKNKLEVQ